MLKVEKVLTLIALPCCLASSLMELAMSNNAAGLGWGVATIWCFSSFVNLTKLMDKEDQA
jgi:hypothetical protein